jgi:hypothetical protein
LVRSGEPAEAFTGGLLVHPLLLARTIFSIRVPRAGDHGGMAFRANGVTSLSREHILPTCEIRAKPAPSEAEGSDGYRPKGHNALRRHYKPVPMGVGTRSTEKPRAYPPKNLPEYPDGSGTSRLIRLWRTRFAKLLIEPCPACS